MIKDLRKLFGLSQADLAAYLRISRTQLSMAEIGHRIIPVQKMLELVNFYKVLNEPVQPDSIADDQLTSSISKQNIKRNKIIQRRLQLCRFKLGRTITQLEELQNNHENSLKIISRVKAFKAIASPEAQDLVSIINSKARNLQATTGIDAQIELQIQISGLEAQIKFLENSSDE